MQRESGRGTSDAGGGDSSRNLRTECMSQQLRKIERGREEEAHWSAEGARVSARKNLLSYTGAMSCVSQKCSQGLIMSSCANE
eukprot:scaffold284914_cov32-Tisochrysis_lutea.AAC.4